MAIYHCTIKSVGRGKGKSAAAKHKYVSRTRPKDDEPVVTGSGNLPSWVNSPIDYWSAADKFERKNAELCKEIEFAIPQELPLDARQSLAESFCRSTANEHNLPYSFAVHNLDGDKPHCHLMLSARSNDGIERTADIWFKRANKKNPEKGGSAKNEIVSGKDRRDWYNHVRINWEQKANECLATFGFVERIDHRSNEERGIEKLPQPKLGPAVMAMEEKGQSTQRVNEFFMVEEINERTSKHIEHVEHSKTSHAARTDDSEDIRLNRMSHEIVQRVTKSNPKTMDRIKQIFKKETKSVDRDVVDWIDNSVQRLHDFVVADELSDEQKHSERNTNRKIEKPRDYRKKLREDEQRKSDLGQQKSIKKIKRPHDNDFGL